MPHLFRLYIAVRLELLEQFGYALGLAVVRKVRLCSEYTPTDSRGSNGGVDSRN